MKLENLLTIIVPCKNEEDYIRKALLSLNCQEKIDGVNVIILDANSEDKTLEEIRTTIPELKYNVKIEKGGSVSYARNKGAELANTEYILFLDADVTIIEKDTLLKCLNQLVKKNKLLVTCKVKSRSGFPSNLSFFVFNVLHKLLKEPFAVGAFFMTKKESFNFYGKFDTSIKQSEDFVLSKKYPKNKFKIVNKHFTQDDRRFVKMGYFSFFKIILKNYIKKNDYEHFKKDINYFHE
jgi:glycosyltransferase involved in cell wall biosynthesis